METNQNETPCLSPIKLVALNKLKPHPRNPNVHPDEQITLLAQVIKANGFRAPIVVSKRSGYVIKGHGKLLAAHRLGREKAPTQFQDYADESAEIADMIADNRIAELSERDDPKVLELLKELENTLPAGFTDEEFSKLTVSLAPPEPTEATETKNRMLSFGHMRFPLTDSELAELERRGREYRDNNGNGTGFASKLLGLTTN